MTDPITQDASENMSPAAIVEAPQDLPAARSVVPDEICDVEAKWWGYQLILTQRAVDTLVECLDYIDAKLTKIIPNKEIRAVIRLILDIKKFRLTRVSKKTGSQGCRLVSPWICPVALVVVRNRAADDLGLYTSVWDSSNNTWGEESAFNDIESAHAPALAQFNERLYCVYRGKDNDTSMYWMDYTSADGWSDGTEEDKYPEELRPKKFPEHQTAGIPTLVQFKNKLYCFHCGSDNVHLWYCTLNSDGKSWTNDKKIEVDGVLSAYGCAAAVFKDRLHLIFQEYEITNKRHLYHISTTDGTNWSARSAVNDGRWDLGSADIPGLVEYKGRLHMVYRGPDNDEFLYHTWSLNDDASKWQSISQMKKTNNYPTDYKSNEGPALAVFDDKLILVHRSNGTAKKAELYFATYNGSSWSPDTIFANGQVTGDNPALVSYMDPNVDSESYVDPSYGGQKLIVAYRGK
jgi:hypothetical protein